MTTEHKDKIIKDFENRINEKIGAAYNTFYIQPYRGGFAVHSERYGVIFNGEQIALCNDLSALENVINAMYFLLNGGVTQ